MLIYIMPIRDQGYSVPRSKASPRHVPIQHTGVPTEAFGTKLSEHQRLDLRQRGVDLQALDHLTPDIIYVRMVLPNVPVPPTTVEIYKPPGWVR